MCHIERSLFQGAFMAGSIKNYGGQIAIGDFPDLLYGIVINVYYMIYPDLVLGILESLCIHIQCYYRGPFQLCQFHDTDTDRTTTNDRDGLPRRQLRPPDGMGPYGQGFYDGHLVVR